MTLRMRRLTLLRFVAKLLLTLATGIGILLALILGSYLFLGGSLTSPPALTGLLFPPPRGANQGELPLVPPQQSGVRGHWPGIRRPPIEPGERVQLDEDALIIGVFVGGRARAYELIALGGGPERHVVNDVLGGRAVTVSFCDRNNCARVFTMASRHEPLELGCGGWDGRKGLILQLDGVDYALKDGTNLIDPNGPSLPYQQLPLERTTWGEWHRAHPDSDVYVAPPELREPPNPDPE